MNKEKEIIDCENCSGTGDVQETYYTSIGPRLFWHACKECGGSGKAFKKEKENEGS